MTTLIDETARQLFNELCRADGAADDWRIHHDPYKVRCVHCNCRAIKAYNGTISNLSIPKYTMAKAHACTECGHWVPAEKALPKSTLIIDTCSSGAHWWIPVYATAPEKLAQAKKNMEMAIRGTYATHRRWVAPFV